MNAHTTPTSPMTAFAPLRLGVHLLTAAAIAIVSPFTALAWPFAMLVGMVLGTADAGRLRGERDGVGETLARALVVAFGVLAMLFFGAIIGGLIAIAIVALVSFSERVAADASPTDRGVARILLFLVPAVMWLFVFPLLGMNVDIQVGG
jgi:hypothetical protein